MCVRVCVCMLGFRAVTRGGGEGGGGYSRRSIKARIHGQSVNKKGSGGQSCPPKNVTANVDRILVNCGPDMGCTAFSNNSTAVFPCLYVIIRLFVFFFLNWVFGACFYVLPSLPPLPPGMGCFHSRRWCWTLLTLCKLCPWRAPKWPRRTELW